MLLCGGRMRSSDRSHRARSRGRARCRIWRPWSAGGFRSRGSTTPGPCRSGASQPHTAPPCAMALRMRAISCTPGSVSRNDSGDTFPRLRLRVRNQLWARSVLPKTDTARLSMAPILNSRSLADGLSFLFREMHRLATEGERPTKRKMVVCGTLRVSARPPRWFAAMPARISSI